MSQNITDIEILANFDYLAVHRYTANRINRFNCLIFSLCIVL